MLNLNVSFLITGVKIVGVTFSITSTHTARHLRQVSINAFKESKLHNCDATCFVWTLSRVNNNDGAKCLASLDWEHCSTLSIFGPRIFKFVSVVKAVPIIYLLAKNSPEATPGPADFNFTDFRCEKKSLIKLIHSTFFLAGSFNNIMTKATF